mgnify:CR=1 FL=1
MDHRKETNTISLPDREGAGCEKATSGKKRTLWRGHIPSVGIYPVTDQEHRQRGKKRKESDKGQKSRNKAASLRRRLRKVLANFDQNGFYLTATYEDATCRGRGGCWRT